MTPDQLANPGLWDVLAKIFGPGGMGILIALGVSIYFNRLQSIDRKDLNTRLKEKDVECQAEMDKAEARWETRFQQMRGDIKEGFGIVAENTKQNTILTAAVTSTRLRNDA